MHKKPKFYVTSTKEYTYKENQILYTYIKLSVWKLLRV